MTIHFPQAKKIQLQLLKSFYLTVKSESIKIYQPPLTVNNINQDLIDRCQNLVRFASQPLTTGLVLSVNSAISYRKTIFEQPKFKMKALELLETFSGRSHTLLTGWLVKNVKTGKMHSGVAQTKIFFRPIKRKELLNYVNDHPVVNYIGGYDPQSTIALSFIHRIDGSLSNFLYQLPLEDVLPIVHQYNK